MRKTSSGVLSDDSGGFEKNASVSKKADFVTFCKIGVPLKFYATSASIYEFFRNFAAGIRRSRTAAWRQKRLSVSAGDKGNAMKSTITTGLLALLLMLCPTLRAEVYTIDFNRGTVCGKAISTGLNGIQASWYCSEGEELIAEASFSNCFYDNKGCGIKIGSSQGQAFALFTLAESLQGKDIAMVVLYASKLTDDDEAVVTVHAGTNEPTASIPFAQMKPFSPSEPDSKSYALPVVTVGRAFRKLKLQTLNGNTLVLHRLVIVVGEGDEDGIRSPEAVSDDAKGLLFNLAGQRIGTPAKGLFIENGRLKLGK